MDHLSASQLNLYIQCSLKYKFQYVDRLPKPFKPSGLAFGSAIHAALAWLHREITQGNGVSLPQLHRIFAADWYAQKLGAEIRYKESETEAGLMTLGKEILRLYFSHPKGAIQSTELPFVVPLVNPATGEDLHMDLEGFIDLIEDDDTIVEFKTSAQSMNPQEVHDHMQLTVYSYAYWMLYDRPLKRLKIVNFVKTKRPRIAVLGTTRNDHDHQQFCSLANQVLKAIRSGVFFPHRSFLCKDCEFRDPCREWKGE